MNDALWDGMASAVADFQLADSRYYADYEWTETVRLTPGEGAAGGLTTPLVTPLTTAPRLHRDGLINYSDGTAPASPIVTINGPITNPRVEGPGWVIELDTSIGAGQFVVVDSRPWALSATRFDGTPLNHTLSRWTRLSNVVIPAGNSEIKFSGIDPSNTASVDISWRAAYSSL